MVAERDYVTVAEAARMLDVSRSTVWRWVGSGRLNAQRLGPKTIRIRRRDVERVGGPDRTAPPEITEKEDIWKDYDPETVRAAWEAARGLLKGLDREAFLREMHEARGQDSIGRPAD
jgi:excisionase family DNA binding protein